MLFERHNLLVRPETNLIYRKMVLAGLALAFVAATAVLSIWLL